ncbi:class I SAM-dependent methyltransferase [Sphingomonas sp. KRR8]|uniref:class I SAM-dependent methyltransferase n=1 Tax=Sphingomonas sp. KRR8 TaxID=2942996 RepID=UPI00202246B1|nr:class I SAM-dependent methyltransferase [Sphingomonas sp. KRR8]URD61935.1 class I SAM-dependent methyltransferase [Sphingomonas sp. KRR8]
MSEAAASTSSWDAAAYARVGSYVPALGGAALRLLDPRPGERILDVGCGDGALTEQIIAAGAEVVGVDKSESMVAAAIARGLDARVVDAADLPFKAEFDAAFSNASLHWMLDKDEVASGLARALRPEGRFAGEFGGAGNLQRLRTALDEELLSRGYRPPVEAANWYPTTAEFLAVYEPAGFRAYSVQLIPRPTALEHGVEGWVTVFRAGWLDRAGVPQDERADLARAVAARVGSDNADYVRLRFLLRKAD